MSYQITISDQERDILAQTVQTTETQSPSKQQIDQLVREFIRNLRLVVPIKSPRQAEKLIGQPRVTCDFLLPMIQQPESEEKPTEQQPSPEASTEKQAEEEENPLTLEALKIQGQQLEHFYHLHNPEEIWDFLLKHQYLVPLLIKAQSSVRKHFPTNDLVLAHTTDPDIPELEDLTLYISFGPDWEESDEALEQFEHEWWPIAGDKADDDLCIMLGGI